MKNEKKKTDDKKRVTFDIDKSKLLDVSGPKVTWQDNSCTNL